AAQMASVSSACPSAKACRFLIHLANLQGGPDNITAIVVKVRGEPTPAGERAEPASPWVPESPLGRVPERLKAFPWSLIALTLGILMAGIAIFLSATDT